MGAPSPPPAPDPKATAQAQAGMNIDTAQANQLTNAVNQVDAFGNRLDYSQGGFRTFTNSDGKQVSIPILTATQTLSPEQARLRDLNQQTQQNIAQIGVDQSQRIGSLLGSPINLSNDAVESRLMDLGTRRLNPQFARDEEALRTRLINSGIRQGSEAWNAEMGQFDQRRNDAMNQLLLSGRGQAINEILTERNQPINEVSALMSGSQVQQPSFTNAPQGQVAGVDYAGLVQDKYRADMAAYQAKLGQQNAMMGAVSGLLAAPFQMYRFSDERVKENIEKVGKLENGLNVYSYNYKGSETPEIGLLAQEVRKKKPKAVKSIGGILAVNYGKAVKE